MKIIIAGDGKVGATLIKQLSAEGHDLTLIDLDPRPREASAERYDVIFVQGNCASMPVLQQAVEGSFSQAARPIAVGRWCFAPIWNFIWKSGPY